MQPQIAAKMFDNLVKDAGGHAAAAAAIHAATGKSISIGSLTKIKNGDAEVPLLWVWALMDVTRNDCFDVYRATTRTPTSETCPYVLSSQASKEGGEAVYAGIRAAQSGDEGHHATAAVEAREAACKFTEMADRHEALSDTGRLHALRSAS